jgi:hypothetical protein
MMSETKIISDPNDSREFLMNDVYLTANHNNSSNRCRKRCKTLSCFCLGFLTFSGINSLFFALGYIYNENLHCNSTDFLEDF